MSAIEGKALESQIYILAFATESAVHCNIPMKEIQEENEVGHRFCSQMVDLASSDE